MQQARITNFQKEDTYIFIRIKKKECLKLFWFYNIVKVFISLKELCFWGPLETFFTGTKKCYISLRYRSKAGSMKLQTLIF